MCASDMLTTPNLPLQAQPSFRFTELPAHQLLLLDAFRDLKPNTAENAISPNPSALSPMAFCISVTQLHEHSPGFQGKNVGLKLHCFLSHPSHPTPMKFISLPAKSSYFSIQSRLSISNASSLV